MSLETLWFVVIAALWTGYFVLEGFDFGVGMSLPFLGRGQDADDSEKRKRVLLNTIGPFWDGNEVWLITAAGAMFAAFPAWYGTLFSGFYLAFFAILIALILRNMGFEYRHKRTSPRWRRGWDICIVAGSLLPPLLLGIGLTNMVVGVPITQNANGDFLFTGTLLTLLNPLALLGGLVFVGLSLAHGMHFIALKTAGEIRQGARRLATRFGVVATVFALVLLLWFDITTGTAASWVTTVLAVIGLVGALAANAIGREGWAFIGSTLTWVMTLSTYFLALFPNLMTSSTAERFSLTVHNAASTHLTLQIMSWTALVFVPITLLYSAWNYWVFRRRLAVEHIPAAHDPLAAEEQVPA
ncbi:cytochrome d ubiquinol oxidase subunit II [Calidifontibacter sp. DB0510]|uniref:Cytochrome d ubiquinol oxidase subunit II n=1 Tax=Metallococcus carri TaxID=1656884 RepID=A0A967EA90_9MICO|nr:cytochrome d ubiquinol oxidase subunit II [Metallococcus carri]NHN57212.1 cytochrome d ubiquinol oxidase subunit II [Metallococcus carri]NOP37985.1 cytochrome d ubiquinol oxidase subunit II [Calidifontibacter sp. DB2511S]